MQKYSWAAVSRLRNPGMHGQERTGDLGSLVRLNRDLCSCSHLLDGYLPIGSLIVVRLTHYIVQCRVDMSREDTLVRGLEFGVLGSLGSAFE
jgi:hypothetical protein